LINQADDLLPKASNIIKNWVIQEFKEYKNGIKIHFLTHAKSRIYLFFDFWTLPNSLLMIAVVVYYMGDDYTVQTRLIALKRLRGSHSGENMAECFLEVAKEYEITD
jgi:rRNA-processing protein FCF1